MVNNVLVSHIYKKALGDLKYATKWKEAINEELKTLITNRT